MLHLYDNPASYAFFGVEAGSTAGKWALADLNGDPATVTIWMESYKASLSSGEPRHFEHALQRDGEERWLSVTVATLGEGDASRPRYCYVAEDVTERRRSEAALEETATALSRER